MDRLVIGVTIGAALCIAAIYEIHRRLKHRFRGPPGRHRPHAPQPGYDKAGIARSVAEGRTVPGQDPQERLF